MSNRKTKTRSAPAASAKLRASESSARNDAPHAWAVAALLALLIGVVYAPALNTPFIYDDYIGIVRNKSIDSLWPLVGTKESPGPLSTPPDNPVSARPLVNLSLALNRYFGELNPEGYHAFNVVVHFCTSMLVWVVIRRTLRLPYFAGRFDSSAGWLAFAVAILWSLHPLQTEAVIYAIQRTELMMAFFYLATLYCSLRYWEAQPLASAGNRESLPSHSGAWLTLAVLACLAGMASKEVMISAPLMVLLFERTFVAGSLLKAVRRSWPLYIGLAATWVLLIGLTLGSPRPNSASFGLGPPAYVWWATQCKVLLMYLRLAVWPWPLSIHYQLPYLATFADAWIYVALVLVLGILTLVLLVRNYPVGFLGTWIFAILAPTSVIPIVTEMAAERRMYLPLVAVVALVVVGGYPLAGKMLRTRVGGRKAEFGRRPAIVATMLPIMLVAVAFGLVSAKRLTAYHEPMGLWQQVLERQPDNYLAHQTVGFYQAAAGNNSVAIAQYREAVRLNPDSTQARYGLAMFLLKTGAANEAVAELQEVKKHMPKDANMHQNLGVALFQAGRNNEAIDVFRETLELAPKNSTTHIHLGMAYQQAGQYWKAVESFERASQLSPQTIDTYKHLAEAYALANQREKSIAALEQGLALARAAGDEQNAQQFNARLNVNR
jgi:tetratricopeptide (TPR) repeat protein